MHEKGPVSWFDVGEEERLYLYQMGRPWTGKRVLEIGCGPGHLAAMIRLGGAASVLGIDYSEKAIFGALETYRIDGLKLQCVDYRTRKGTGNFDVLVMQGLLEHLDNPWVELKWMIDNLLAPGGMVITSSPCFVNPRGYIWMALATMFNAPMSLTDKHFLHPWQFNEFAEVMGMKMRFITCEIDWGNGQKMMDDFKNRLPKVMRDLQKQLGHSIPYRTTELLQFLKDSSDFLDHSQSIGAVAVYRLTPKNA